MRATSFLTLEPGTPVVELTTDELAERVGVAHVAETLDELDAALANVSIS